MESRTGKVELRNALLVVGILLLSIGVLVPSGVTNGLGSSASTSPLGPASATPSATTYTTTITSVQNYSQQVTVTPEYFGVDVRNDQPFSTVNAEQLANARTLTWRYPGGGQAEFFNVSTNKQVVYGNITEANSPSNVVAKCELVHCHLIFQLPAEIDSPSTDAYYVSYVENTLHFTPFMWELGNEPAHFRNFTRPWTEWPDWQSLGGVLNATPLSYAAILPSLVSAIRSVDHTTPISAIGGTGSTASNAYIWYYDVAASVGPEIQYVSIHSYLGGGQKTTTSFFYQPLTTTLNRLPISLPKIYSMILSACPSCTNLKVILSEDGASIQPTNSKFEMGFPMAMWDAFETIQASEGGAASVDLFAFRQSYPGSFLVNNNPNLNPSYFYAKDITPLLGNVVENVTYNAVDSGDLNVGVWWASPNNWSMVLVNIDTTNSQLVQWGGSGFPTTGEIEVYIWNSTALEPTGYLTSSLSSITLAKNSMAEILAYPSAPVVAPAKPFGVMNILNNTTSIRISWAQPAGPVANDSISYGTPSASAPYCTSTSTFNTNESAWGYTLTGLRPTTNYCFAVEAWNSAGGSGYSSYVNISTILGAVTGLKASGVGRTYVDLTWTNPAVAAPYSLTNDSVSIEYDTTSGCFSVGNESLGVVTSDNVTGLRPGIPYCFAVSAWDQQGQGLIKTIYETSNQSATPYPTLDLNYIMGGNATTYSSPPLGVPSNALILVGIGIRNAADIPTVSDSAGDSFSLVASNGTRAYSSAPNALFLYESYPSIGVPGGSSGVTFTCNNGGATFAGLCEIVVFTNVYSSPIDTIGNGTYGGNVNGHGRSPFDYINTTSTNETIVLFSAESNSLSSGITFTSNSAIVLNQSNQNGSSNLKQESLVDGTHHEPSPTVNQNVSVLASATGGGVWQSFSVSVRGSQLISGPRSFTESGFTNHSLSFTWINPSGAGVDLRNDTVYYSTNGISWTADYLGVITSSATLTGLTRGILYYVYVEANNVSGAFGDSLISLSWTYDAPPPAPTGVVVTSIGATTLVLNWTNPVVGGLINDTVYISTNNVSFTQEDVLQVVTSDNVSALSQATVYYFYVTATTNGGEGSGSSVVKATTVIAAPSSLVPTTVTGSSVTLTWTNPTGVSITNVTIWYGTTCGNRLNSSTSITGSVTTGEVVGLRSSTTYCFEVQVWHNFVASFLSSQASATTSGSGGGGGGHGGGGTHPIPITYWGFVDVVIGYGIGVVLIIMALYVFRISRPLGFLLAIGGIAAIIYTALGFPT
jgi:Fibronectin type III domain